MRALWNGLYRNATWPFHLVSWVFYLSSPIRAKLPHKASGPALILLMYWSLAGGTATCASQGEKEDESQYRDGQYGETYDSGGTVCAGQFASSQRVCGTTVK